MRLGYKVKGTKCNLSFRHLKMDENLKLNADYYEDLKKNCKHSIPYKKSKW